MTQTRCDVPNRAPIVVTTVSTVRRSGVLPAGVRWAVGEALTRHDQRQHDRPAIAAVIAGIAAACQVVLLGQALEVGTGQVVEQQVVVEPEQGAELVLEVVLDRSPGLQQSIQGPVQAVFGHGAIGDTEEVFQGRGAIPVLRRCRFTAGGAEPIDDLDGHDVGGPDGLLCLGDMSIDDLVEVEELPEPEARPDIAEASGIGPAHRTGADAHGLGIIGQGAGVGIGEEAELSVVALAIVKDDGASPASFLVMVEFAEGGDDVLSRPRLGAHALDEGVIGVGLAAFVAGVSAQGHRRLLVQGNRDGELSSR
jgi:hypothetical protein